ncbi:MAG: spheroidene monooxygenase [Pseudomonadota bacterium]
MQTVTLSVFRFEGLANKLWAFSQMQFAHASMRKIDGLQFYKLFGSGSGESFTPVPNFGVYAVMAAFSSREEAQMALSSAPVFQRYFDRSSEALSVYLSTFHTTGSWDGKKPFEVDEGLRKLPSPEPIGILTRASIRKRRLLEFWRSVPEISDDTTREDGLLFKLGIGEIPWLHQVTFSVWSDRTAMMRFAYQNTAHAKAAKAAHERDWFSEDLFARFHVIAAEGSWKGEDAHRLVTHSTELTTA